MKTTLTREDKQAMGLRRAGYTFEEIAKEMNVTPKRARSLCLAKKKLEYARRMRLHKIANMVAERYARQIQRKEEDLMVKALQGDEEACKKLGFVDGSILDEPI